MNKREPLIPGFSISYKPGTEFPSLYQRKKLGYEPYDLFVTEGTTEDELTNPDLILTTRNAEKLKEPFEDINIIFRYQLEPGTESENPIKGMPEFQNEAYPASLTPNTDLNQLADLMQDSIEDITSTDYLYSAFNSAMSIRECEERIQGSELILSPESQGICSIKLDPISFNANIFQYRQNVEIKREKSCNITGRPRVENIYLGYDETEIEEIEEALENKGFKVNREKLPPESYPEDIF